MSPEAYRSFREKLIRAQNGDHQAREELIQENLALVKHLVKRFMGRGAEYEDLYQYGCVGLLKAVDRFDPDYPVQFSTYAVPVIMGEIRRYLRDDGPVHISRTIRERAARIEAYTREHVQNAGSAPSVEEIAEALGIEQGDVLLALNSKSRVRSLEERVGEDGTLCLKDVLGADPMAAVDRRLTLTKLLGDLSSDERNLIVRRYFKSQTQTEIARELGTSQVQVSRMEGRILKRMRAMAGVE